jgi:hypothetical protein
LVLGLGVAALIVFIIANGVEPARLFDPSLLWSRLIRPLIRMILFISLGLGVGQFIEALGLTARLGVLARPLVRRAKLPAETGAAFTAAFASGVAANTLLFTLWQEGKLDRRELVLSNLLNASLPAYLLHLPTTFFVVYALLGRAALLYFGLTLGAALLRLVGVVLIGALTGSASSPPSATETGTRPDWRRALKETWPKFLVRLRRLLLIIVPIYVVFFVLVQAGFFTWLTGAMAGLVKSEAFPAGSMSVIVVSIMAEFTSGFAAAAAFLEGGALTISQVVIALLIGNVLATPIRALRHQLPHYMGIYSPRMGLGLVAIGQSARLVSVLVVTAAFVLLA